MPYGAVCNFADGPGNTIRKTFSYFSLVPFGYANFTPLITAIITCIMFILLIIYVITNKQVFVIKAKNILYVCILFSLGQFIFGLSYFSIVSGLITITLVGELLLLIYTLKQTFDLKDDNMRKILVICLLLGLVSCGNKTIGKLSGTQKAVHNNCWYTVCYWF